MKTFDEFGFWTEGRVRAADSAREMGEEFIRENEDGRAAYEALKRAGLDHEAARNEVVKVLLGTLWEVENNRIPPTGDHLKRYLRRLAGGETPEEIFSEA